MTPSLFFSLLAVLLPLTGALPGHDHSHAHVHRDFHNNIQRDHGHGHAHVHRDALDVQPAVEPRASPTPGCGRKPKEEGSGTGTESSLSSPLPSGSSTSLGGIFALKNAEVVTVTTTTDIVIEPVVVWTSVTVTTYIGVETVAVDPNSTPTTSSTTTTSSDSSTSSTTISSTSATSTSSVEALKTQDIAAQAAVASSSSSILQAFQSSHTLATLTTSTSVNIPTTPITTPLTTETTSTSEAATVTAGAGAGGVSTGDVDYLTVVVRNMMTDTLTTSHAMNADLPANIMAITATLTDGTMTPGATASMIFPSGWAGNMVAAKAATSEDEVVDLADGSLIEGSFVVQTGDTPVNDMDVSYVSGFSVPISCSCEEDTVVFGCNIDLFAESECPDTCDGGACLSGSTCRNPLRELDVAGLTAAPFFLPCQGKAFTWAQDDANSQNSKCTSNYISCCIGTEADGCPSATS